MGVILLCLCTVSYLHILFLLPYILQMPEFHVLIDECYFIMSMYCPISTQIVYMLEAIC